MAAFQANLLLSNQGAEKNPFFAAPVSNRENQLDIEACC